MVKMPKDTARSTVIGIRVDKALYDRLTIRAIRNLKSISEYCYGLIYNDVYRKRNNKRPNIDSVQPGKE